MKNSKVILAVKFNSTLGAKELANCFEKDLDLFKEVPGLVEKYYVAEDHSGANGGIYIFESKNAMSAFLNSELAKSIPDRYGVIPDTLRVEQFDVTIDLNEAVLA